MRNRSEGVRYPFKSVDDEIQEGNRPICGTTSKRAQVIQYHNRGLNHDSNHTTTEFSHYG